MKSFLFLPLPRICRLELQSKRLEQRLDEIEEPRPLQ